MDQGFRMRGLWKGINENCGWERNEWSDHSGGFSECELMISTISSMNSILSWDSCEMIGDNGGVMVIWQKHLSTLGNDYF